MQATHMPSGPKMHDLRWCSAAKGHRCNPVTVHVHSKHARIHIPLFFAVIGLTRRDLRGPVVKLFSRMA